VQQQVTIIFSGNIS